MDKFANVEFMGNEALLYFPGQTDGVIPRILPILIFLKGSLWLNHLHAGLGNRVSRKRMENISDYKEVMLSTKSLKD